MFQNQIFQVKCFNLEIFEIFQTCPAHNPKRATTATTNNSCAGYAVVLGLLSTYTQRRVHRSSE